VAEGDAAVHAARTLLFELVLGEVQVKFLPILNAFLRGPVGRQLAVKFHKTSRFSHFVFLQNNKSFFTAKAQRAQSFLSF
jgi:hypothetical protein